MPRFSRLMVTLIGDEARDASLLRYAALAARLGEAKEIHCVHVAGAGSQPHDELAGRLTAQAAKHCVDGAVGLQCAVHVLRGPRVDALLSFAAENHVDLIVVGHRPDQRPGRKALIRRLTMKAPCSIWIVPNDSPARISRVLAPVDFSDHSADALEVASDLAMRAGASECIALHVYQTEAVITYEESAPLVLGQEKQAYERFVSSVNVHGIRVRPIFVESEYVPEAIHRTAAEQQVDLKVISTRGRSRSAAILLGSVAEAVIVEARTPVLVVKHFGAKLNLLETLLHRAFRGESPHFG